MNVKTGAIAAALGGIAVVGCLHGFADTRGRPPSAEPLHTAVHELTRTMVYDIFSPPQASRAYAYASVAAYEAMRPGDSTFRSLAGQLNGLGPVPQPRRGAEYDFTLAGVHAFMTVGKALTFSQARMDSVRRSLDEGYRAGQPRDVYERSIAYGDSVAAHILAWSKKDNYLRTRGEPKYTVTNEPGRWVPTPPAYMDAVEPHWQELRPFVLDSASQFRAEPPYAWDTTATSRFMREAREVYDVSKSLTDEQRAVLAFWDCNPYVMHVQGHAMFATKKTTPGGHWMGIAATVARKAGAGPLQAAEAYALTAVALADGFIASWDTKFATNVIRPETVINKYVDESWEPALQTPPFPEYTSGHSMISTAAAQALTSRFGGSFAFTDSTEMEYGLPPRSFSSFEAAAAEAAISRLYGGIHFRRAIEQGQVQGRKVGQLVVARVHTRTKEQPAMIVQAGAPRAPARGGR